VQAARDKFAGQDINPQALQKLLSAKEMNNLGNNMRNSMSQQVKEEYSKLSTDLERKNWLAQ
jgi:hypothetical protein